MHILMYICWIDFYIYVSMCILICGVIYVRMYVPVSLHKCIMCIFTFHICHNDFVFCNRPLEMFAESFQRDLDKYYIISLKVQSTISVHMYICTYEYYCIHTYVYMYTCTGYTYCTYSQPSYVCT